jgi:hypothetical protein
MCLLLVNLVHKITNNLTKETLRDVFVIYIQSRTMTTRRHPFTNQNNRLLILLLLFFSWTDKNQINNKCFFTQIFNFNEQNSHNDHNGKDPIFQITNQKINKIKCLIFLRSHEFQIQITKT